MQIYVEYTWHINIVNRRAIARVHSHRISANKTQKKKKLHAFAVYEYPNVPPQFRPANREKIETSYGCGE